jgi:hypothetical protein
MQPNSDLDLPLPALHCERSILGLPEGRESNEDRLNTLDSDDPKASCQSDKNDRAKCEF